MADHVDSTSTASVMPKPSSGEAAQRGLRQLAHSFLGLVRFSHTLFALPFALLACVMAVATPGFSWPPPWMLAMRMAGVLLCMVFARSAAMAFNRLVDAKIDRLNPRTRNRHIPSGELRPIQVWVFFCGMSIGFVAACLLFLPNWLPLAASLPVLLWICGYSLTKRFTSGAHIWLGISLALSPICSWVALRGETVLADPYDLLPPMMLALAIACWVAGFDIIYACQDAEFDQQHQLKSVPARFGIAGALRISAAFHLTMLVILALLPWLFPSLSLGSLYAVGLAIVAALILRQHTIVRPDDLRRVGEAFFTINVVISLGLCSLMALDTCLR